MDVNGTRFHLFKGTADWGRCCEQEECAGNPNQQLGWSDVHLDPASLAVTLGPLLSLFKHRARQTPLPPSSRRGAAADRFGNWYWISNDRKTIYWLPFDSKRASIYWSQTDRPACPGPAGGFEPRDQHPLTAVELSGLTITEHHYLVVGDRTDRGFFIFDLDAGGDPVLMIFPDGVAFDPFDMAPAPGGGVWVLDRANHVYWGLDRQFRVVAEPVLVSPPPIEEPPAFKPVSGTVTPKLNKPFPAGFPVNAIDPIAIESLPDGSVLILDSPALSASPPDDGQASSLLHYRLGTEASPSIRIEAHLDVAREGSDRLETTLSIIAYDFAYTRDDCTLFVVERDGNQAMAFALNLDASPPQLVVSRDYLPMHFFGGRSLVAHSNQVFYDVLAGDPSKDAAVRWVSLQVIDQPRYERAGTLFTPALDGKERDCVWHRLFLDGCIPAEARVRISSRAQNDEGLLSNMPFVIEPDMYLRGRGAEIPFYNPFPDKKPPAEGTGTWELLFQRATGRYLQLKIELSGNGRVTPHLHAMRAYYPRFSYPKRYLPTVYQDDRNSADFLERMLANMEGFLSDTEGKIADVSQLFDARSASPEALDWLASWLGLVLDPLWSQIQQRRTQSASNSGPLYDRRRLFIRFARKLFHRRGTPDGIRFALHLLLDPCLEKTVSRFKAATLKLNRALADELLPLGLPYPDLSMSDEEIEDLVYDYLLAPARPEKIRLVERFLTRGGRETVQGDPTAALAAATNREGQSYVHRFSVLVPQGLSAEEEAMVGRVVDLEKPAHTEFDVGRYWDFFRVGETRLGLDTVLGEESRFAPMVIGRNYLGGVYLKPPNPMDVEERVVSDRERVGFLPGL